MLVVGASATGIQLAAEIHESGRPVTLSVGRHIRLPRRYRGRDILAWFHDLGMLDEPIARVEDPAASRAQPSLQLVGTRDHADLDLGILQERGVRLVGRTVDADGRRVRLADDLAETIAAAEFKLARLRRRIDAAVDQTVLRSVSPPSAPFRPVPIPSAPGVLDLGSEGIRTVLWATGFRRTYPWLHVPVLDRDGEIRRVGGVTDAPGLYVLGLNFQRRRSSSFLHGVGSDATELAGLIIRRRTSRNGGSRPSDLGRAVA